MWLEHFTQRMRPIAELRTYGNRFAGVQGFLDELEGYTLAVMAETGPGIGVIAEIGSFKGLSTLYLAAGSAAAGREKVYAIDHFHGSPEHQRGELHEDADLMASGTTFHAFEHNLRAHGLFDQVVPCPAGSPEAAQGWPHPVRLLFIDGDHSYEATRRDFETWEPFVCHQGLIAFHDVGGWEGVTRFYKELRASRPHYREVIAMLSLRVVQKLPAPGA